MAQTQLRTEQVTPSQYPHYIQEPYDGGLNAMTAALLHFNSNFTDEIGNIWTARSGCPTGTAGIDNNIYKWGGGSVYLKENPPDQGDYFDTPFADKFNIKSYDFSLEFWINLVGVNTGIGLIVGVNDYSVPFYHSEAGRRGWSLFSDTDGIKFAMNDYIFNSGIVLNTDPAWSSWHHLAFCRQGNLFSSYYDGNRTATGTSNSAVLDASGTVMSFGEASGGTFFQEVSGRYDEFRFVVGSCSYSGTSFVLSENVTDEFFSETAIIGVTTETTNIDGRIPQWTTTGTQLNNGLALVVSVGITGSNASVPSEKAVRDAIVSGTVAADAYALGLFNSIPTGSFLNLNDTPDSYAGYANYYVQVNPSATGLSFGSGTSGGVGGSVATDTIWNAKGDLAVGVTDNSAQVFPVGANGNVLVADSLQPSGLRWATGSFTSFYEVYAVNKVTYNPDKTVDTQVDNLAITFSLSEAHDCVIMWDIRSRKSGGAHRYRVYDGTGTQIAPVTEPDYASWYSIQATENNAQMANYSTIKNLASGTHMINIKWQAAANTNTVDFYDRYLGVGVIS